MKQIVMRYLMMREGGREGANQDEGKEGPKEKSRTGSKERKRKMPSLNHSHAPPRRALLPHGQRAKPHSIGVLSLSLSHSNTSVSVSRSWCIARLYLFAR